MTFFPLSYRCDIKQRSATTARSGQKVSGTPTDIALNTKCLFLATSGDKRAVVGEAFETSIAFYVEATTPIEEGYLIYNIRDKAGNVVEEGPFEVMSVKKTPGLSGKIHHKSCKIKGCA